MTKRNSGRVMSGKEFEVLIEAGQADLKEPLTTLIAKHSWPVMLAVLAEELGCALWAAQQRGKIHPAVARKLLKRVEQHAFAPFGGGGNGGVPVAPPNIEDLKAC